MSGIAIKVIKNRILSSIKLKRSFLTFYGASKKAYLTLLWDSAKCDHLLSRPRQYSGHVSRSFNINKLNL